MRGFTPLAGPGPGAVLGALASVLLLTPPAGAASDGVAAPAPPTDPLLTELIEQSVAVRPELRQAEATVRAERERIPQAGALPDPVLSLGIQNDGFDGLQIGKMETSFYQVMLSQGLPWPGKRGLRTEAARLSAEQAASSAARVRLGTEADVRRAYVDLVLARDRLGLLGRLEAIWRKSAGVARARYETGEGAQSDFLRAQLELNRIRQRRWLLEAQERTSVQALNRLRTHPLDEPIATPAGVVALGVPEVSPGEAVLADALARSPELALDRLGVARADTQVALARRERYPDLGVNAGIMPRGDLDPMWQAGVSLNLPVWSYRKQSRAVAENEARAAASARSAEATEQILRLRVAERQTALAALLDTIRIYREGLLVQSRATAESTLAQYQVGRVSFASVLEANAGYVDDEESYLAAVADAQRIAIATREVSLDPVGVSLAAGRGAGGMPGAASAGGGMTGAASSAPGQTPGGAMGPTPAM